MRVAVDVHDQRVRDELRSSRRDINRGVKEGLKRGAERHGLPRARRLSPSTRVDLALRAGATTRSAYIELRKKLAPHGALLEFGGTRRDVIRPKDAEAIMTPFGPRAVVKGPRRYRAQRFMKRAVEQTLREVTREAGDAIGEVFIRNGLELT